MASTLEMTDVERERVVFPLRLPSLGPHISSAILVESLVTGEFANDLESIIRNSALVVRPAISYMFLSFLASLTCR